MTYDIIYPYEGTVTEERVVMWAVDHEMTEVYRGAPNQEDAYYERIAQELTEKYTADPKAAIDFLEDEGFVTFTGVQS